MTLRTTSDVQQQLQAYTVVSHDAHHVQAAQMKDMRLVLQADVTVVVKN